MRHGRKRRGVGDWFDTNYYRGSPARNPQGPASGEQAVLRGGEWNNNALNVRAPNRNRNAPANRNDNIGFRCAKTPRPAVVEGPESLLFTDGGSVRGGV